MIALLGYIAAEGPGNVADYKRPVWSCGHEHATRAAAIACLALQRDPSLIRWPTVEQEVPREEQRENAEQLVRSIRHKAGMIADSLKYNLPIGELLASIAADCDLLTACMGKAQWPSNGASS